MNSEYVLLIKYCEDIQNRITKERAHTHEKLSSIHHKFGISGRSSPHLPLLFN